MDILAKSAAFSSPTLKDCALEDLQVRKQGLVFCQLFTFFRQKSARK
jgi:hypothetical protein